MTEMAREWRSKRAVERDRERSRRLVIMTSASVVVLSALTLLVLPAGWRHPSSSVHAPEAPSAALPIAVPRVTITKGSVSLDGITVGDTSAIEASARVQRIDGLFDAMRRRRDEGDVSADGSTMRSVDVEVAADVPAVVVKSVVQTLAFAGYADVRFAVLDASVTAR